MHISAPRPSDACTVKETKRAKAIEREMSRTNRGVSVVIGVRTVQSGKVACSILQMKLCSEASSLSSYISSILFYRCGGRKLLDAFMHAR